MPCFPADWRGSFGMPAAEHRVEPLVHVFQEYVVFELEAPAVRPDGSDVQEVRGSQTHGGAAPPLRLRETRLSEMARSPANKSQALKRKILGE